MRWVADRTGRFAKRPHYQPAELDAECEALITAFLTDKYRQVRYPIETNDLVVLVEQEVADLDLYADLSDEGADVEGVTYFRPGGKPEVRIAKHLAEDPWGQNRLRTTITHELGHVRFHSPLWPVEPQPTLFGADEAVGSAEQPKCRRETMLEAAAIDWMEWQAGYACGAFLMPISAFQRVAGEIVRAHGQYGRAGLDTGVGTALVSAVRETFSVSADAARVRLERSGFIGHAAAPSASLFDAAP